MPHRSIPAPGSSGYAAPQHPGHPDARPRGYPLHPHGHPVALQIGGRLDTAGQGSRSGRRAGGGLCGLDRSGSGLGDGRPAFLRSRIMSAGSVPNGFAISAVDR